MSKVCAFTTTRADTPQRLALLANTFIEARKSAGYGFNWHVVANGVSTPVRDLLNSLYESNTIQYVTYNYANVGQHVAWNDAFQIARAAGYDYFLRIDDDCEFTTKRWLKKLVDAMARLDNKWCLAPKVQGLNNQPPTSQPLEVSGLPLSMLVDAIGGICRIHYIPSFIDYISDVRLPMGAGDATGVARYCQDRCIFMGYLRSVRVRHGGSTAKQEATDPEYFKMHGLKQVMPYIPAWTEQV